MLGILKSMYGSVWASVKVLQNNASAADPYTNEIYYQNFCLTDYFECLSGVK